MSTTGQCYYASAREEVIVRLRLRDQILISFIVSSGAILGLSIGGINEITGGKEINSTIALIVPFIAWGTSILVSAHSISITNIGRYCSEELAPSINEC